LAKRGITKKQCEHLAWVKEQPCVVCGSRDQVAAHHCGIKMGMAKNHMQAIPLCFDHHQGKNGFHTLGRKAFAKRFGSEAELLEKFHRDHGLAGTLNDRGGNE